MYSVRGYIESYTLQRVRKSPVQILGMNEACFIGFKKTIQKKKSLALMIMHWFLKTTVV
jgi:hypothetical protein